MFDNIGGILLFLGLWHLLMKALEVYLLWKWNEGY